MRLALAGLLIALLMPGLPAQGRAQDPDEKAPPVDPYTKGDPELMAALGYESFGPFTFGDDRGTHEIDQVLGKGRVLWLETAHFKIGCSLKPAPVPPDPKQRRLVIDELKRLRQKLPKVNPRTRKLDRWLRLHLCAQRLEDLYADFCRRLGVTDDDFEDGQELGKGKYLGQPGKYLVILLQKRSDFERYLDRFAGIRASESVRHNFQKSHNLLVAITAEGSDGWLNNPVAMHSHLVFNVVGNLIDGYHGYYYQMPVWWSVGLAHWYSRRVFPEFINVTIRDDEAVDEADAWNWPKKVRARVGFDHYPRAAELLKLQKLEELDFVRQMMSWSRVDYLMSLGDEKFAAFFEMVKGMPIPRDGIGILPEHVMKKQDEALQAVYDLDAGSFDERWKKYVLRHYPRR